MMRSWTYLEQGTPDPERPGEEPEPVVIVVTEAQILATYFEYWKGQMVRAGTGRGMWRAMKTPFDTMKCPTCKTASFEMIVGAVAERRGGRLRFSGPFVLMCRTCPIRLALHTWAEDRLPENRNDPRFPAEGPAPPARKRKTQAGKRARRSVG